MKKIVWFVFFGLLVSAVQAQSLQERLQALPEVDSVFALNAGERYLIWFGQPLDHSHPEKGRFPQKVILTPKDDQQGTVCVLHGYAAGFIGATEITEQLLCNQVNIEHRFFAQSRPDSIPWDLLTVWQAATDHHVVIQALKSLYPGSWLTTGISKGGQVTMFHKVFYPHDVQASVPYVAPLNFAREDQRIYDFFETVGTAEERKALKDFQQLCFAHADALSAYLEQEAEVRGWAFDMGYQRAVELTILEYPFAFWQWGKTPFKEIPGKRAKVEDLFKHLQQVADFGFFDSKQRVGMYPFYWSALTEIGMYGYLTQDYPYFSHKDTLNFEFSKPPGTSPVYDTQVMAYVKAQLDEMGNNMLFVVGGLDPWGATAYVPSGKTNALKLVHPAGHHDTRIRSFDAATQEKAYQLLQKWMD